MCVCVERKADKQKQDERNRTAIGRGVFLLPIPVLQVGVEGAPKSANMVRA